MAKKTPQNPIGLDELISTMIFLLEKCDAKGTGVTENTKHDAILGDNNPHNEALWYQGMISIIIKKRNGTDAKWPGNWMTKTSKQLAPVLLQ